MSITPKEYLGLALVVIALAIILFFFASSVGLFNFDRLTLSFQQSQAAASLTINYGEGRVRQFNGEIIPEMTILDAILASAQSNNFVVDYQITNVGLELRAVDGLVGSAARPLQVLVNSQPVEMAKLHQTAIKSGDLIEVNSQ